MKSLSTSAALKLIIGGIKHPKVHEKLDYANTAKLDVYVYKQYI